MAASCHNSDDFTIDFLNKEFGSDIKSLSNIKDLCKQYRETKVSLEKQLTLASNEVPNEIKKAICEAEEAKKAVYKLGGRKERLHHNILDHVRALQPIIKETSKLTEEVQKLERFSKYLSHIVVIEDLSEQIQAALLTESIGQAVEDFRELKTVYINLHQSKCCNLVNFAKETMLYWYKVLKEKIAREFEEVLKSMQWPLVAMTIKTPSSQSPVEIQAKMEQQFKQLLNLQLPSEVTEEGEQVPTRSVLSKCHVSVLPLQLMMKPLRKRFRYHFYGNKQTNDLGKPEWYFTLVLSWIRDHTDFLEKRIQPLLVDGGKAMVDAKVEFMKGMVAFVVEKMNTDLPDIMYDEHQFSHLVDQSLLFDRELRLSYAYPPSLPGSLHILSEGDAFEKWLLIEKKFAIEKLDVMMSSATAWESQYRHIADVDELKVPECGESFMTLMLTITERYKPLPHPVHKLQFLDLQLELLEDFRIRLVQVKDNSPNPLGNTFCSILNTAFYISEVLREWSELVFFLQLQFYRTEFATKDQSDIATLPSFDVDLNDSASIFKLSEDLLKSDLPLESTVFEDMIKLLDLLRHDMVKTMVHHVFTDVRARSKPYREDKWMSLPFQKDLTLGLSTSACEMLLVLKDHLLEVGEIISKPVFVEFWQKLSEHLNFFIFEEVITRNSFNDGGAAQLNFDMARNLFPLFGEFTQKPENYFKHVKESCILLTLKTGSAILLKELLYIALHSGQHRPDKLAEARAALNDVRAYTLDCDQAELVLSRRANLSV